VKLLNKRYNVQFKRKQEIDSVKWTKTMVFGNKNTEKNANLRKILILLTNISKIIICFSELLFDASSNIDFFVTD
jgi:hypothetical protein